MNKSWYEVVAASTPLTQGDIIRECPVLAWGPGTGAAWPDRLEDRAQGQASDLVVITQARDFEQKKVTNVIVCGAPLLDEYKTGWLKSKDPSGKNPNNEGWKSFCRASHRGAIPGFLLLNSSEGPAGTGVRLVDFQDIYTIPIDILTGYLAVQNEERLRLVPPYREHFSQAFARFFMRVALPTSVPEVWGEPKT